MEFPIRWFSCDVKYSIDHHGGTSYDVMMQYDGNTIVYVMARKIWTVRSWEVIEHILETRNVGLSSDKILKKICFWTWDPLYTLNLKHVCTKFCIFLLLFEAKFCIHSFFYKNYFYKNHRGSDLMTFFSESDEEPI